jgi:hypothetical protein
MTHCTGAPALFTLAAMLLVGSPLAACRQGNGATGDRAAVSVSLAVTEVRPAPIVIHEGRPIEVMVHGTGFDPDSNVVRLGPVTVSPVPSTNGGTLLTLMLPDRVPSGGGAAPMLWTPGRYPLTVTTRRGTSAPVLVDIEEPR